MLIPPIATQGCERVSVAVGYAYGHAFEMHAYVAGNVHRMVTSWRRYFFEHLPILAFRPNQFVNLALEAHRLMRFITQFIPLTKRIFIDVHARSPIALDFHARLHGLDAELDGVVGANGRQSRLIERTDIAWLLGVSHPLLNVKLTVEHLGLLNPPVRRTPCTIDFCKQIHAPIAIDAPDLQNAWVRVPPVYPTNNVPNDLAVECPVGIKDLTSFQLLTCDEMDRWIPFIIDYAFRSSPYAVIQTQLAHTGQCLETGDTFGRDCRIILMPGLQHARHPTVTTRLEPVRRIRGIAVSRQLLVGHDPVAQALGHGFPGIQRQLGCFLRIDEIPFR